MSQVIDTKVVEMQFDNSKFEKNIEVSLNSLKFLNKNIEDAGKNRNSLDELAKAGDQVGISFDNMNMKSKISLNMFDMLAGVGTKAFNRISDAVAGFALNMANSLSGMQAMRDGFNEYELKMGSVQTILAGAKIFDDNGKSVEDEAKRLEIVNEQLEKLNAYSDKTIYSFKDMTSNIGKFTNAGVNLDDSVQAIQGVANVAAVSGANAQEASRAMYNFSQALSSGAVKLIDWKSIENANMATVEFKQQLLDTAVALGTVVKEGNLYQTTTTDAQGKVSDWFNSTTKFNDALSNQWMTTEVLTQTLKNYSTDVNEMTADEVEAYKAKLKSIGYTDKQVEGIIKLSKKAFAAATEVKTFSQMIDTLKESLGSGWAQTFEIVFGDFKEAKKLWTDLNNTIDGLLSPIGKARNAILKVWKYDGGREALIQSFKNLYHVVENLISPIKNLWTALTPNTSHTGKILSTITKGVEKLTAAIAKVSDVVGKILAIGLKPFIFIGNIVGKGLVKFVGILQIAIGKIVNLFSPVVNALATFKNNMLAAFDKHITSRIKSFQIALSNAFSKIKNVLYKSVIVQNLIKAFKDLRTVIQDLFGQVIWHANIYADRFISYLREIWNVVSPLISSAVIKVLQKLSDLILPKIRKALMFVTDQIKLLGTFLGKIDLKKTKLYKSLVNLPNTLKAFSSTKIFSSIKNFGSEALTFLADKFKSLKTNLDAIKMPKGLSNVFSNIKGFIKSIFGAESVGEELTKVTDIVGEESSQKLTAFQKFINGISEAFELLKNAAITAKNAVGTFIKFIIDNTPKALKAIHNFIAGDDGILTLSDITDIIYTVSDALSTLLRSFAAKEFADAANGISGSFTELTESVTIFLKRVSNKMKMAALKDFAIAVGILAGALFLLAMLPTDKILYAGIVLVGLAYSLTQFFDVISSGKMALSESAGFLPIAALILSIGAAMIGIAASVGILVGALAVFPRVIKAYNNLGDEFRTGMDRVKEVLKEIFEYLDHTISAKYGFRSAAALLGLVISLDMIRKTIVKFANKKTGEAMAEGLTRIEEVLNLLSKFFNSISFASFSFVNIGVDLDMIGMAAMILALGNMIKKIAEPITEFARLSPGEFAKGFGALTLIFLELGAFLSVMSFVSKTTETSLAQWLGMAANVTLLASAISTIVRSLSTMSSLAANDADSFKTAINALRGIFIELGAVLTIIGVFEPSASVGTLFGLSLVIGVLTACVVALTPLADSKPWSLIGAVSALGLLMLALGKTLSLVSDMSSETSVIDIIKLIAVAFAMIELSMALRRLAKTTDPEGLVAAGLAISGALLSMGGAIKLMNKAVINPTVLIALGLLAVAIWGVAYAISAFKNSAGGMTEGAAKVSESSKEMEGAMQETTNNLAAYAKDVMPEIIQSLGESLGTNLKEVFQNFDLGSFLREKFEELKADAKNWAQDFIDIGTNLMDGIAVALSNPSNIARIKECMAALGRALVDAFKAFLGINSPSTVMIEQGGFIIDGLVQGLMEYPAKLAAWVTGIGRFILDGIGGLFTGAIEKGKTLIDNIGAGIQNGKDFVSKKASEIGTAALNKIGNAREWAGQATKSVQSFGLKLRNSKSAIKSAAGSMIVGAVNAVTGMSKVYSKTASAAASTFASQIKAGASPTKAAAKAIVEGAKAAFKGIQQSFNTFGQNAAQGFRNGINSLISSIAAKAREMVRRAKDAAKSEQHSNSPSKDFMEFGGWAAQGYALGMVNRKNSRLIEKNARLMVSTAKNAASDISFGTNSLYLDSNPALGSLAYAMAQISDSLDESVESSPTIRPVIDMSNINRNASVISALFGDKQLSASIDATRSVQNDFERTMASRNSTLSSESINRLAHKLTEMTESMNSRTMNNYITVDGADDPQLFADRLVRSMKLNARTI